MSFSFFKTGPADEMRAAIKAAGPSEVPKCLQEFLLVGINGLKDHYGPQVDVDVALHGHLCIDGSSYEISHVELRLRKRSIGSEIGDAVEKAEAALSDSGAADSDPVSPGDKSAAVAALDDSAPDATAVTEPKAG